MNSVSLRYDPTWRALIWAKENCPSYISNGVDDFGKIVYYFSDEHEATIFCLKWIDVSD